MDKAPTFVGIDVSKHRLDVHARPSGESFATDYDDEGVAGLVGRLAALAPALVVLEATGGLEVRPAAALAAAGLPGAVVDPRQVRALARAPGRLAETDRLHAEAIAPFPQAGAPPGRALPGQGPPAGGAPPRSGGGGGRGVRPWREGPPPPLAAWGARRRQLLELLGGERNRRYAADPALREGIDAHLHWLEEALAAIERDLGTA